MAPKKSKFIWIIIIVSLMGMIFSALTIVNSIINLNLEYILSYYFFLNILVMVLSIIFLYKLYYLKEDVIKWTHVNFLYHSLEFLVGFLIILQSPLSEKDMEEISRTAQELGISIEETVILTERFLNIFVIVILSVVVLIWFFFSRHLKKFLNKKTEELSN